MSGRLHGKVALITGIARGQGRSHALRLSSEGAAIIGIDICAQVPTVASPMSKPEDLYETVRQVEEAGGRIVARIGDIRDREALTKVLDEGIAEFGGLDVVVANAGIAPVGSPEPDPEATFRDAVDVNLYGTWQTIEASIPTLIEQGRGGSIILTSSTQGLSGRGANGTAAVAGYAASKHGVVGLMRTYANSLARYSIRVNSVHPTGVDTPMVNNPVVRAYVEGNPLAEAMAKNALPVGMIEARDISAAVAFLASDDARYVTGVPLPVDAGFMAL